MELARDQALGSSRNKASGKPVGASKARDDGKGKGKARKSATVVLKVKTRKEDDKYEEDIGSDDNDDNDDDEVSNILIFQLVINTKLPYT
jgi:hypothetical protein